MPIWYQNILWLLESDQVRDKDSAWEDCVIISSFSPAIHRWIDDTHVASSQDNVGIVRYLYSKLLYFADWSLLNPKEDGSIVETLRMLFKRLRPFTI